MRDIEAFLSFRGYQSISTLDKMSFSRVINLYQNIGKTIDEMNANANKKTRRR